MKRTLKLALVLALTVVLFAVAVAPVGAQSPPLSYLVVANGSSLPNNIAQRIANAGGTLQYTIPEVGIAVATSSNPSFKTSVNGATVLPNLRLNWINDWVGEEVSVETPPSPPFTGDDDFFFDLQWGHTAIGATTAWAAGLRGAGVRVAVLDTGFDMDHPDLAPNINYALSTSFVPGEGVGYALPGPFSHGTHTAGTIAAADNAFGTIGVAPEAELLLVKVLTDAGSGEFDWVIQGIVYAANNDADIISMSLGDYLYRSGGCDDFGNCYTAREAQELLNALSRATNYAFQMGTTVIASAGNAGIDGDHDKNLLHIPSDSSHVISISATAPIGWATDPANIFLDNLASYSNYGQSVIEFGAPGGDFIYPGNEACTIAGLTRPCWVFDLVFSTGSNLNPAIASYYWSAGTSMAAPHAAGVAALIIGANGGDMHPAQVEAAMARAADDLGKPGNDDFYGAGRVSAANLVQ